MKIADHIPDDLKDALDQGHLAVLCGAGISMLPPSSLPSWWGMCGSLLEEIRNDAKDYVSPDLHDVIEKLDIKNIPVQSLSDEIVNIVAGRSYFSILQSLDDDNTNENHHALASLAKNGVIRVIITTNFDTLIERAFKEQGVPLKTYVYNQDYSNPFPEDICVLLKVHGTANVPETMVDTISQKRTGLQLKVKQKISEILSKNHLLVLGFSGIDFDFCSDYMTLKPAGQDWRGVTWLKRRGDKLGIEALSTLVRVTQSQEDKSNSAIFLGELPSFFNDLGIEVSEIPSDIDVKQVAEKKFRSSVREWLSSDLMSPELCVVFCTQMLSKIGRYDNARSIRQYLGSLPSIVSPLTVPGITPDKLVQLTGVYHNLAIGAIENNEWEDALSWLDREIKIYSKILEICKAHEEESAEEIAQYKFKLAGALLNKVVVFITNEKWYKALILLEEILKLTEDDRITGSALCNLALVSFHLGESKDELLKLTRGARDIATNSISIQIDSYGIEAQIFLEAKECGHVFNACDSGIKLAKLSGALGHHCNLLRYKLEVYLSNKDISAARETVAEILQIADSAHGEALGMSSRIEMIPRLNAIPELKDIVDPMLIWLDETMQNFVDDDPRVKRYHKLKEIMRV